MVHIKHFIQEQSYSL